MRQLRNRDRSQEFSKDAMGSQIDRRGAAAHDPHGRGDRGRQPDASPRRDGIWAEPGGAIESSHRGCPVRNGVPFSWARDAGLLWNRTLRVRSSVGAAVTSAGATFMRKKVRIYQRVSALVAEPSRPAAKGFLTNCPNLNSKQGTTL
jgi:hypothetical protein